MSLQHAGELIAAKREDEAFKILIEALNRDPDDAHALFLLGTIYVKADYYGPALLMFKRAMELRPDKHQIINNVGMALESLGRDEEARAYFEKAHALAPHHAPYASNVATTWLQDDPEQAERWAAKALKADPEATGGHVTMGFAQLGQAKYATGWDHYKYAIGTKWRIKYDYDLPDWDGQPVECLIVAAEQGLGDEIMFMTCLPDLLKHARLVIVDCDPRLEGLFRRSFQKYGRVVVHGTRGRESHWLADSGATHQTQMGELARFYRRSLDSFLGSDPYLVPDPDMVQMYSALVRKHAGQKQRVGLCFTGGSFVSAHMTRDIDVAAFRPFIEKHQHTHEFFSLEYAPDAADRIAASGLPIHHFPYAVGKGVDYDHTAAFIATMDIVIGTGTTAHHAAGALGRPNIEFVPARHTWQYAKALGNRFPWYKAARLFRQEQNETWAQVIQRLTDTYPDKL